MLDRKTKDIDASIELLEDRKKESKYIALSFMIMWMLTSIGAMIWLCLFTTIPFKEMGINTLIYLGFGVIAVFIFFIFVALIILMAAIYRENDRRYLNTLIYLKKHLEHKEK